MDEVLRVIAGRASSLLERLTPEYVPVDDPTGGEAVENRLRAWALAAAKGDRERFRRRLVWEGGDEAGARRAVGRATLHPNVALPAWTGILAEVLRARGAHAPGDRCLELAEPIPFEEVLLPFVLWARSRCQEQGAEWYASFADAAHACLERQLLVWLSGRASRCLALEFSVAFADQESSLDALLEQAPSRVEYEQFVAGLLSGGLLRFFEEYSVLARVLVRTAELWVEATLELLQRLHADLGLLRDGLEIEGKLLVVAIQPALSDPHARLRSVSILTFASGQRVVYKPRDLSIEVAWNALLSWLEGLGAPAEFRTFRVLSQDGYGWAEFVDYASAADEAEAGRYFFNAGALLCVIYWLYATDCHADNVVAAGRCPALIDVETLLSPRVRVPSHWAEATRIADFMLSGSVLASYFLPAWSRWGDAGQVFDGSALGVDPEQEKALPSQLWAFVNTDRMRLVRGLREKASPARAALSDGRPLRVYEHEPELVEGFASFYRFLVQRRAEVLAGAPFQQLRETRVRFVYRHTTVYAMLLERLREPRYLRDGAERSIQIEQLALAAGIGEAWDGRAGWVELWNAEREASERGDVPYFSTVAGGTDLSVSAERSIVGWFTESGYAAATERLKSFDEADLALQTDFIRSSLRSRAPSLRGALTPVAFAPSSKATAAPTSGERQRAQALSIARAIVDGAIQGSDGSLAWLQPVLSQQAIEEDPRRDLAVVSNDLYDGALGIGLFLASVERSIPGSEMGRFALGAIRSVLLDIERQPEECADSMGIGGFSGLGSVVYGLSAMGMLLREPELLVRAEAACRLITPERIAADTALDVTWGSAGALLGLLRLHEVGGSTTALAGAICCGERLVSVFEPVRHLHVGSASIGGKLLTGFAHGAAGIAYALCRLHSATREPRLLALARRLVAFERGTFLKDPGDWPDLRYAGAPRFAAAWCHGAPGIALGRVASLAAIDDEETRAELALALRLTARADEAGPQHLCCGAMGRIEILSSSGKRLARPDLVSRASELAQRVLSTAEQRGGYALGLPAVGNLRCCGLFQGLAGVGLTLLRLAATEPLPEPLLLL